MRFSGSVLQRIGAVGLCLAATAGCGDPQAPPTRHVLQLWGSPYQRGLQHGQQLADDIRALYTTLLTTALLPYLNREQGQIAAVLPTYQGPAYQNGQFAYQLLLDSARAMELSLSSDARDEMQGVADGCGLSYEQILLLNTFPDATLAVRALDTALQYSSAPRLTSVAILGLDAGSSDGGVPSSQTPIPELVSSSLSPYVASPIASATELPVDAALRFVLQDPVGVDPASIRVTLGSSVFTSADSALDLVPLVADGSQLQVTLTPPQPLPEATAIPVSILAADFQVVSDPPPAHERFMRQEWITVTTAGYGRAIWDVPNGAILDGAHPPASLALAISGSETASGQPLLAQNFALVDANTAHNHTAVFVHHPDAGGDFAVVGWSGIVWGFSGLNQAGQGYACQPSDTLDNTGVGSLLDSAANLSQAKLVTSGMPIGFAGRRVLEETASTGQAVALLQSLSFAYGWNCLLVDASGEMEAVEIDSGLSGQIAQSTYSPDPSASGDLDPQGQAWASIGASDLHLTAHFKKNSDDMFSLTVQGEQIRPQAQWAPAYFMSVATDAALVGEVGSSGPLTAGAAMAILASPTLVDPQNSMNAVVLEPAAGLLHVAQGAEPATAAPFETVSLQGDDP